MVCQTLNHQTHSCFFLFINDFVSLSLSLSSHLISLYPSSLPALFSEHTSPSQLSAFLTILTFSTVPNLLFDSFELSVAKICFKNISRWHDNISPETFFQQTRQARINKRWKKERETLGCFLASHENRFEGELLFIKKVRLLGFDKKAFWSFTLESIYDLI